MTIKVESTKNALADAYAGIGAKLSLWSGNPTGSGTECSGGSYARQTLSWGAASSSTATASEVTFEAPAGTWDYVGLHDSGGDLADVVPINSTTLGADGQVKVTYTYTQS